LLYFNRRAAITNTATDTAEKRVQQVSMQGVPKDVEVWFPYGMSGNVPVGSLGVIVQIGPDPGNLVFFPDRSQDRIKDLKDGEVAFFNPITKSKVVFKQNGDIETTTAGSNGDYKVTVKGDNTLEVAGNVVINVAGDCNVTVDGDTNWKGDFNLDGDFTATGDVDGKTLTGSTDVKTGSISLKTHLHIGSPTAATGPVTPTGAPI